MLRCEAKERDTPSKPQHWSTKLTLSLSRVMRHILLDYAKSNTREKRGGGVIHVEFDETATVSVEESSEIIALDAALERLSEVDPVKAKSLAMNGLCIACAVLVILPLGMILFYLVQKGASSLNWAARVV